MRLSTIPNVPFTQRSEIRSSPKDVALGVSGILHDLAKLHIVEHFHSQSLVGADRVIDATPNHVERTDSHVILRSGRPLSRDDVRRQTGSGKKRSSCVRRGVHDHARKQDDVVGVFGFGIGHRRRSPAEKHVGVGEEKPVAVACFARRPHGVDLPNQPRAIR